jgi:phage gp29-like protein
MTEEINEEPIPAWQQDDIDALEWENDNIETEEQKAVIAIQFLREERDRLLSTTDWWVMPDRTATDEQRAYRQALRDITDTYTSLEDVVWPTKPD